MAFPSPEFPTVIWDGLSDNRCRISEHTYYTANGDDYWRVAAEIISIQEFFAIGGNILNVTSDTDLSGVISPIVIVDATSGPVNITLPSSGKVTVKKVDSTSNSVTLLGQIDGQTNLVITNQYDAATVIDNSTEWSII